MTRSYWNAYIVSCLCLLAFIQMIEVVDGFVHPGVVVSQSQLDYVRSQLSAGDELANTVFKYAKTSQWGVLPYTPTPSSQLRCGSASYQQKHPNDTDNTECTTARDDGLAAYTQALIWAYDGGEGYAISAMNILNEWSSNLSNIKFVATDPQFSNGVLQAGWMMEFYPRAAEILKYATNGSGSYSGWPSSDSSRFGSWVSSVFLPLIWNGWPGDNNWDFTMISGTMNIGIYTENETAFNIAIDKSKSDLVENFYISSDGSKPVGYAGNNWYTANTFFDGLTMETCRDAYHTQYTFASVINAAETARIQGAEDLYAYNQARIIPAFEFNAWLLDIDTNTVPSFICDGTVNFRGGILPTWDIFYNNYHNRQNLNLPNSTEMISKRLRPSGKYADNHMMAWEALTHANTFNN